MSDHFPPITPAVAAEITSGPANLTVPDLLRARTTSLQRAAAANTSTAAELHIQAAANLASVLEHRALAAGEIPSADRGLLYDYLQKRRGEEPERAEEYQQLATMVLNAALRDNHQDAARDQPVTTLRGCSWCGARPGTRHRQVPKPPTSS